MFEVFANPGYLAAGAALVSSPVIIHLINRMRFKRLRWAAMEFLLKAQKRTRKRLIIEQIILLLLRCLLVALVGLLVSRFLGFSFAGYESKDGLHVIVLDDTVSMNDQVPEGNKMRAAFDIARETITDKLVKEIGKSTTKERVVILSLSRAAIEKDQYQYKTYLNVSETPRQDEIRKDLEGMKVSPLHVDPVVGLTKARQLAEANAASRVVVHVVSDFRHCDWGLPHGKALHEKLKDIAALGVKVRLADVAYPFRGIDFRGVPESSENVAITDFRAGSRVIGTDMPVTFEAVITNFGTKERAINVVAFNETDAQEMLDVDFNPSMPATVKPGDPLIVKFDKRFNPNIKEKESYFANLSIRLENADRRPLEKDGLANDNIRYTTVEVRKRVPILVIDGLAAEGRKEGGDSYFIHNALISVPGASYDVVYGDEIAGGVAVRALERSDLTRYPTIFMLNVRELTPDQTANLENYVNEGGAVAFFMGEKVDAAFYNKALYKDGKGIFPVPLRPTFHPPAAEDALKPEVTGLEHLLLRDDLYPIEDKYPIFGKIFPDMKDKKQRDCLRELPIKRYYQVPRGEWKEGGRVKELATLPNSRDSKSYQQQIMKITGRLTEIVDGGHGGYSKAFKRHAKFLESLISPTSDRKAYQLAVALKNMLDDPGRKDNPTEYPNLKDFWGLAEPKIIALRQEVNQLHDELKFGDPFVVLGQYGSGKVVAVMSTAGKAWNDWAGGSASTLIFQPFVWEMQNELSKLSSEANRTVGGTLALEIDKEQFVKKGQLRMSRTFYKPQPAQGDKENQKALAIRPPTERFGTPKGKNHLVFTFERNLEAGLYITNLLEQNREEPLVTWGHVFNIDSEREGRLARTSWEEIEKNLPKEIRERGLVQMTNPNVAPPDLVNKPTDLSESPWLFLVFLLVLVAEQALAVHLSFHLKGGDAELHAPKAGHAPAQAA